MFLYNTGRNLGSLKTVGDLINSNNCCLICFPDPTLWIPPEMCP